MDNEQNLPPEQYGGLPVAQPLCAQSTPGIVKQRGARNDQIPYNVCPFLSRPLDDGRMWYIQCIMERCHFHRLASNDCAFVTIPAGPGTWIAGQINARGNNAANQRRAQ